MENQYRLGEFVIVQNPTGLPIIGEVIEALNDSLRLKVFFYPEDTRLGRHAYNAKNEVYQTEPPQFKSVLKIQVISQCRVVDIPTYQELLQQEQEKDLQSTYVWRQQYEVSSGKFSPPIPLICLCKQPFNPDLKTVNCSQCNLMFHTDCLNLMKKDSCTCGSVFGEQVTKKRKLNNSGAYIPTLQKVNSSSNSTKKEQNKYQKYELNEESIRRLDDIDNALARQREMFRMTSSKEGLKRQQIIDNFQMSLELAVEEMKTQGQQIEIQQVTSARDLAMEIESNAFIQHNDKTDQLYMKKCRTLHANLSDPKNTELRAQVVLGHLSPSNLCSLPVQELAPSSLKKLRQERETQYLKDHMVQENAVIMLKTHKGEHVIEVDHSEIISVKQAASKEFQENNNNQLMDFEEQKEEENEKDINKKSPDTPNEDNYQIQNQNQNQNNQHEKNQFNEFFKVNEVQQFKEKQQAEYQIIQNSVQDTQDNIKSHGKTVIAAPSGRSKITNQIKNQQEVLRPPLDNSQTQQFLYQECKLVTQNSLKEKFKIRLKQNLEFQQQKMSEEMLEQQIVMLREAIKQINYNEN